jgi:hypothetical protein
MRSATITILCTMLFAQVVRADHRILRGDTWSVTGIDHAGFAWTGTTLKFTRQTPTASGYSVEGFFYWVGSGGQYGRERFVGTLALDGTLQMQGVVLIPPINSIVTSIYTAKLSDDGLQLLNGKWVGGVPSDSWTAVRGPSLPEVSRGPIGPDVDVTGSVTSSRTLSSELRVANRGIVAAEEASLRALQEANCRTEENLDLVALTARWFPASAVTSGRPKDIAKDVALEAATDKMGTTGTAIQTANTAWSTFDALKQVISASGLYPDIELMWWDATGYGSHAETGVPLPATTWYLAEGVTGPFFDCFILLANPNDQPATVDVEYLLLDGTTRAKSYTAPAQGRFTVWVDDEEIPAGSGLKPLDNVAFSTTLSSTVPIIVERTMWWPSPALSANFWTEAHNSPGAVETGTKWVLAEGEVGGTRAAERAMYSSVGGSTWSAGTNALGTRLQN